MLELVDDPKKSSARLTGKQRPQEHARPPQLVSDDERKEPGSEPAVDSGFVPRIEPGSVPAIGEELDDYEPSIAPDDERPVLGELEEIPDSEDIWGERGEESGDQVALFRTTCPGGSIWVLRWLWSFLQLFLAPAMEDAKVRGSQ